MIPLVHSKKSVHTPVDQLHISHWCCVTWSKSAFKNSKITTRTIPESWTEFIKQFDYCLSIPDTGKGQSPGGQCITL
jgi:hypothetical protein